MLLKYKGISSNVHTPNSLILKGLVNRSVYIVIHRQKG